MPNEVVVTIEQEDIDNGKPVSVTACPVALAIKRAMPGQYVLAAHHFVSIYPTAEYRESVGCYSLPDSVSHFITCVDGGRDLPKLPFTFTMKRV